jgi:hypothetical protein
MRKNSTSQSGLFNPRVLLAFALCSVGAGLTMLSFAATPPKGITNLDAKSPRDSLSVDKHSGPLGGNAKATTRTPLAQSAAGSWSIVTSPNASPPNPENFLQAVTCVSASACWAVGYYFPDGGISQTLIERWDGASWAIVTSPNTSAAQNNGLLAVTCSGESECWAVGVQYTPGSNDQTLIERWDGISWTIVTSPNTSTTQYNYLDGVTCTSASDCWAVGDYSVDYAAGIPYQTLIERWDGTSWSIVSSPNTNVTQANALRAVTCTSASDCWAVGFYNTGNAVLSGINQTLIERWDGSSWTVVTSPNASSTRDNVLRAVTCASASDCRAVGYYYNGSAYQTLVERWDGSSWALVTSANSSSTDYNVLYGVTCPSSSDCWAVGYYYPNGTPVQTLIERWNGSSWTIVTSPNTSTTQYNQLQSITCASASDCWAVGDYQAVAYKTLAEHYTVPPVQLNAVVSRKVHGSAGTFDINLPLTGTRGVECRSGGTNSDYTMIFTFSNPLASVSRASVTSGTGTVSTNNVDTKDTHNYIVNLTGVSNAQYITVTLSIVTDSVGNSSTSVQGPSMGVLVGDVNATRGVDGNDVSAVQAHTRQPLNSTNFVYDVNTSGLIDGNDVSLVQSQTRTSLPSPP